MIQQAHMETESNLRSIIEDLGKQIESQAQHASTNLFTNFWFDAPIMPTHLETFDFDTEQLHMSTLSNGSSKQVVEFGEFIRDNNSIGLVQQPGRNLVVSGPSQKHTHTPEAHTIGDVPAHVLENGTIDGNNANVTKSGEKMSVTSKKRKQGRHSGGNGQLSGGKILPNASNMMIVSTVPRVAVMKRSPKKPRNCSNA